jgi:hypothetical protein
LLLLAVALAASACSASSGSGPAAPPGIDVDPTLAPFAGLCPKRRSELAAALCPSGSITFCDPGCTYYLSADGNDGADGRAPVTAAGSGPWQTLDRLAAATLANGQSVCFRRGDTFRGSIRIPWGSAFTSPVAFQSYGDPALPRPILSGARQLPRTWTATAVAGIYQLDASGVLWQGTPYARNGKTYTPHERVFQLFVDGKIQPLARFPNVGQGDSTAVGVELPTGNYSVIDDVPAAGRYTDTALPAASPLVNPTNFAGAALFHKSIRWIIDTEDVASHSASAHQLTVSTPLSCASDACKGWGYFLVDSLSALDAPGEWYYDAASKVLTFWPPAGVSLASASVEVSTYREDVEPPSWAPASAPPEVVTSIGLDLQGGSGIRVRDLSFRHYSHTGIWASSDLNSSSADGPESTTDVRVEGCEFLYTGGTGVVLARWSAPPEVDTHDVITGCTFRNQLSTALSLQAAGAEVSCNEVSDVGLLEEYPRFGMTGSEYTVHDQGMAVLASGSDRAHILFNRFSRTSSAAISFRSPDAIVAYNVVREACYTKSDCGGIHTYTWDDALGFDAPSVRGSLVARNIVLDTLGATEGAPRPDWIEPLGQGMMLDFGAHDFTVAQNVVAGSTTAGLLVQRDRNVRIEQNLLYDNDRYDSAAYTLGALSVVNDKPPTGGLFRANQIFSVSPQERPLAIRGDGISQAGAFQDNLYFYPYGFDDTLSPHDWDAYTVFTATPSETFARYSLQKWIEASGETGARAAPARWQTHRVTAALGPNLVTNGSFDADGSGWTTESWSPSKVAWETHPVLGPCLRYDRNGATGGRIGALSNVFSLKGGHTYWVHFWIAVPAGADPRAPRALVEESQPWQYVPGDGVREVNYLYTPPADVAAAQFELTPYPLYADRYWLDDVVVQEVQAEPYRNAAVVRFDGTLPADARSILVFNDTEEARTVALGAGVYLAADGTAYGASATVPPYGGVVLVPAAWMANPGR